MLEKEIQKGATGQKDKCNSTVSRDLFDRSGVGKKTNCHKQDENQQKPKKKPNICGLQCIYQIREDFAKQKETKFICIKINGIKKRAESKMVIDLNDSE